MEEEIKNNPDLLDKYPIFDIKYNKDGSIKKFYELSSEKEIKETQIKSDENELDYKYNQKVITKEEYDREKSNLDLKLKTQNYLYDNLIFDLIKNEKIEDLKIQIKNASLEKIELKRLSTSLLSIAEEKIKDFEENNKEFKNVSFSVWNANYDIIAKNYAKTRELESYILNLIG